MFLRVKRAIFIALFAFLPLVNADSISDTIVKKAQSYKISENSEWLKLLHYSNNKSVIQNPEFFITKNIKSSNPQDELTATIQAFFAKSGLDDSHAICRFPARFLWLNKVLQLDASIYPNPNCRQFNEYKTKVPVSSISVVFASENVSSPASALGHVFFKLKGENSKGELKQHALTYFTNISQVSPLKLVSGSLLTGLPGYYALSPYEKILARYQNKENRNIWDYKLDLSSEQIELLTSHFWELKNSKAKYLYASYNCATAIYYFLQLVEPSLKDTEEWLAPIDIINAAEKVGISSQHVIASPQWIMRALQSEISSLKERETIRSYVKEGDLKKISSIENEYEQALAFDMRHYYLNYLLNYKELPIDIYGEQLNELKKYKKNLSTLHLKREQTPLYSPKLGRLAFSISDDLISLDWQAIATKLEDDHANYFNEYETSILNFKLNYDFEEEAIRLNKFTAYSIKSYLPADGLTKSISGNFSLAVERFPRADLSRYLLTRVEGGVGYTRYITRNIMGYASFNSLLGYGDGEFILSLSPDMGLISRTTGRFKSLLSFRVVQQIESSKYLLNSNVKQSYFISKNNSIVVEFNHWSSNDASKNDLFLHYVHRY